MYLGQEFLIVGQWFRLHFTENEGMAFGLTLGGQYGKIALTLFRIVAVIFIGGYLKILLSKSAPKGLIISLALIFSGALGNIIDSTFFGVFFTDSINKVASVFPADGGYAPYFYGKVVDMLYIPIYQGFLPSWVPFWGDTYFIFFRPVFNIADAAITAGVLMIILFQKRYFKEDELEDQLYEEEMHQKKKEPSDNLAEGDSSVSPESI